MRSEAFNRTGLKPLRQFVRGRTQKPRQSREPVTAGVGLTRARVGSSPCLIRFEIFSAHRPWIFGFSTRFFKKVVGLRDITAKMGFMSRSVVAHQSLMVEEPVAIQHRR